MNCVFRRRTDRSPRELSPGPFFPFLVRALASDTIREILLLQQLFHETPTVRPKNVMVELHRVKSDEIVFNQLSSAAVTYPKGQF